MKQYHTMIVSEGSDLYSKFIEFPFVLYGEQAQRFKNQFVLAGKAICMLLLDGDTPCGRLALYENKHLNYLDIPAMAVGNYECIDDEIAAQVLLDAALELAKKKGYYYIIGPMNGSTWKSYRFIDEQTNPLFFTENLHESYYAKQFTSNGFGTISNYVSQVDTDLKYGKYLYLQERFEQAQVIVRPIKMQQIEADLLLLYELCSEVFISNFLYTPISASEFVNLYLPLMPILNPDMILLAEDRQTGKLAGFIFAIPNLFDKSNQSVIVKTLARNPARKYAGITQLLGDLIMKYASEHHIKNVYHAFMHIDNTSVNISTKFSGSDYRHYTLFGKQL